MPTKARRSHLYDWEFVSDYRERKYRRPGTRPRAGLGRFLFLALVWVNALVWMRVINAIVGSP